MAPMDPSGGKPLGSLRLSNIADGIEDWELFNKLGATSKSISNAADLIIQLVSNQTAWTEDPVRFLRRPKQPMIVLFALSNT